MQFSRFGTTLGGHTGIMDLMDDMGRALAGSEKKYMLGGGNPAHIPEVEAVWRERMQEILDEEGSVERMLGNYDSPQGQPAFIEALTALLNREFDWNVKPENVAITNGSQTAFFILLNMLSGPADARGDANSPGGGTRSGGRILFPLMPEYIGYADQGLDPDAFVACRPHIERIDEHTHKYHIDFDAVEAQLSSAQGGTERPITAICVSRPTNPSGNVLTDQEMHRLDALAQRYEVPLIIDNAYGMPFPHIVFDDVVSGPAQPMWNENIVLGMSLSKIGLPGTRTGIIVGSREIVDALSRANAVLSLANTTVGQVLVEPLLRDGRILELSRSVIRPFYRERADRGRRWISEAFDPGVPFSLHRTEGALFLWLWLPDLPITSRELYERLKARNVIVVPGEYFFFGDPDIGRWSHAHECLRINYGQEPADTQAGLEIIADEVNSLWR
ncbi:MAG: valine--pyruvate transaminase [Alkalispirochaeta sp.]